MKKTLLVIGAGVNQAPIIQTAKNLGYYVIAVSPAGDYPGFAIADEAFYEDIFHMDAIVEFAKTRHVDGVISDQSDMAAPIVAYIAEKLGLPNFGYENALDFTDKIRMRALYEKLGLPVPRNHHAGNEEEALRGADTLGYPMVIKPADAFASRGVFIIHNEQELREHFAESLACSRSGNVIEEEFLEGSQYFCQGLVDQHKLYLYAFSDRYYYNLPNLAIPYTNAFPAKISDSLRQRMQDMLQTIVDDRKPLFGHVWAEWIYNEKTDTLYMVEMAIRGGGAYVTTHLIPAAYGVDSQPYLVRAAVGDHSKCFADEKITPKAAAFYSFLLPEGEITHVAGLDEAAALPGVMEAHFNAMKPGDIVPPIKDKSSRYGLIIVRGENRDELDEIHRNLQKTIDIGVRTPFGEKGAIWT